jgi:hypothetical protein
LELKAGDVGLANRLLDRARSALGEAAPIWLLMTIESRRYALSKVVGDEYEHRWLTSLKKSRRSAPAGEMCRISTALAMKSVNYLDREDHVARLLDFLRDCKRVKWEARDLRNVLDFLIVCEHREEQRKEALVKKKSTSDTTKLLADLATKARGKFPDNSFFQLMAGEMELRKGPLGCNRPFARDCFERVLKLVKETNDPDSAQIVKRARKNLDQLREIAALPFGAASAFSPPSIENEDGNLPEYSFADLPAEVLARLAKLCQDRGLDLEEMMEQAAAGEPFQAKEAPPSKRKPWK